MGSLDKQIEEMMKPKVRSMIKQMVADGVTVYGLTVSPDEWEYIKQHSKKPLNSE